MAPSKRQECVGVSESTGLTDACRAERPERPCGGARTRLVGWAHGAWPELAVSLWAGVLLLSSSGCDKGDAATSTAAPSATHNKPLPARKALKMACRETKAGARFLVGEVGEQKKLESDGAASIDLPFAVEVGSAVATSDAFALSALKGHQALVAMVSKEGGQGSELQLDEVHGDVEPPKLASDGDRLVAAVVGNDAGSNTLTLVAVQRAAGENALTRGGSIEKGRDGSNAFDIALGEAGGLLVWDRWDKAKGHGIIEALPFDPTTLDPKRAQAALDLAGDDAETPRVVRRPGGFWLVWVSHGAPEALAPVRPTRGTGAQQLTPARPVQGGLPEVDGDVTSVIDVTPRRLKVAPVDAYGAPTAQPTMITPKDSHVLAYDALAVGGGLLLAWRDDPTTLGVEAPKVHVADVRIDGSVTVQVVEDQRLRAGTPRLFLDARAKQPARPWLSLIGEEGRPLLGYFEGRAALAGPLQEVSGLGLGEPLAMADGRLVLARPNGRALDIIVVGCELKAAR